LPYRDHDGIQTLILPPSARAYAEYTQNASIIPFDDTIPESTEGTEILTANITLKRPSSRVRVRFDGWGQCTAGGGVARPWAAALFRDLGVNALQAQASGPDAVELTNVNNTQHLSLEFEEAPGSVGPFTYKIRAGGIDGGTLRLNGKVSGRIFGGASRATLTVEEIFV
jgi:hypothetical protein